MATPTPPLARTLTLIVFMALAALSACASTSHHHAATPPDPADLPRLSPGMSLDAFHLALQHAPARNDIGVLAGRKEEPLARHVASLTPKLSHQFTIAGDLVDASPNVEVLCLKAALHDHGPNYYFLFHNRRLDRIVLPPPFEFTTEGNVLHLKSVDPMERLHAVSIAPSLTIDQALADTTDVVAKRPPSNLPNAAIQILLLSADSQLKDQEKRMQAFADQAAKHDSLRIHPGDEESTVIAALDQPRHALDAPPPGFTAVKTHGQGKSTFEKPAFWSQIFYRQGRVAAIFSGEFVDNRLVPELDSKRRARR
jgi:hypothetical protein